MSSECGATTVVLSCLRLYSLRIKQNRHIIDFSRSFGYFWTFILCGVALCQYCVWLDKLLYARSLDVKVCFTYTANPENYAPSLGKPSHLFLYKKQDLMIIFLVVAIRNYMINSRKRKVKALHSHLCSCACPIQRWRTLWRPTLTRRRRVLSPERPSSTAVAPNPKGPSV